MNLDAGCSEQNSFRCTDNSTLSSNLMLAEAETHQRSKGIIGRRTERDEPRFVEFSNPFRTTVSDASTATAPAATTDAASATATATDAAVTGHRDRARSEQSLSDLRNNYTREVGPNGRPIFRDRTGLEVQTVGNVSPSFEKRMLEQIQLLPEEDRRQLAAAGIKVLIAKRVIDAEPSIANERPRNWSSNATQRDADGIYLGDRRAVVVAESTRRGPNNRAEGVLRHEVGHALNDAFGNFSNRTDFIQAYQADVNSMDRAQQSRMAFWRQARGAGRDETFADVYAALRGGVPNAEETRLISQSFPRVTELVRRRIGQ